MRYLVPCIAVFATLLLGGCGGTLLQLPIQLPFTVSDFSTATASPAGFWHWDINQKADNEWSKYLGQIAGFDGVKATMHVINADTIQVTADIYVSSNSGLSSTQVVASGKKLMTVTIPAGESNYDSGWQPLSQEAGQIISTAQFSLYAIGTPTNLNITCTNVKLEGKFRVNVL